MLKPDESPLSTIGPGLVKWSKDLGRLSGKSWPLSKLAFSACLRNLVIDIYLEGIC